LRPLPPTSVWVFRFGVVAELGGDNDAMPIAIITADIQDTSRQRGVELGAAKFINKPAKEAEVRHIVRQLLQK